VTHLLFGAEEAVERGLAVRARDPSVAGTELELGDLRVGLDDVERGEQRRGVNAVANGRGGLS
jgi:hypothetical protein